MKYVVIGAGGTGGFIGAYLANKKQDVTLIARGAHLQAIREKGLEVHSANLGDITLPVKACTMEEYSDTPDVIFVCVKYYSLEDCIAFINRIAAPHTLVIPILNGFGVGDILATKCPVPIVMDGCIYIFGMIQEPGIISQPTSIFRIFFGFRQNQLPVEMSRVHQIESDLKAAGIDANYTESILREAITKFSFVSPMGTAGLYYDGVGGDFMVPGEKQDTFFALIREVEALGNALGVSFDENLVERNTKILMGMTKDSTTSMQRDVKGGGATEADLLIHRIARLAKEHHISLPTYEKISTWAYSKGIS